MALPHEEKLDALKAHPNGALHLAAAVEQVRAKSLTNSLKRSGEGPTAQREEHGRTRACLEIADLAASMASDDPQPPIQPDDTLRHSANWLRDLALMAGPNVRGAILKLARGLDRYTAPATSAGCLLTIIPAALTQLSLIAENARRQADALRGPDLPPSLSLAGAAFRQIQRAAETVRQDLESASPEILGAEPGLAAVVRERRRQIAEKGWTLAHDREHGAADLLQAGGAYLSFANALLRGEVPFPELEKRIRGAYPVTFGWPWPLYEFKPSPDNARNLARGAALVVAALDVLLGVKELPPTPAEVKSVLRPEATPGAALDVVPALINGAPAMVDLVSSRGVLMFPGQRLEHTNSFPAVKENALPYKVGTDGVRSFPWFPLTPEHEVTFTA